MSDTMALYQMMQANADREAQNSFPNSITEALTSFQGGMDKARQMDYEQVDRITKLIELQQKVQEYQERQAVLNQMADNSKDYRETGKTANIFQSLDIDPAKAGPEVRKVAGMIESASKNVPNIDWSGYETALDKDGKPILQKKAARAVPLTRRNGRFYDMAGKELSMLPEKYEIAEDKTETKDATATKVKFEMENKLRDDYRKDIGDYPKIRDSFTRIMRSAEDPSAAGDLAMIYNYMKLLDPGSVVRESEFAQAAATGSYGERIQSAVKRTMNGQRLDDSVRNDFVARSKKLYSGQEAQYKKTRQTYGVLAKKNALDEGSVIVDVGMAEEVPAPVTDFASEAEAEAANLPAGTVITIGGRKARVK